MRLYEFRCSECRHVTEVLLRKQIKMSDGVVHDCEKCGKPAMQMFPRPNVCHGLKFGVKLRHPETGKIFEPKVRK